MKTSLHLIFATALVIVFSVNVSAQENVALIEDFETGKAMPDQWRSGASISGVEYVYYKNNSKSGERSLSLQKSAKRYFPIAQWFRKFDYDSKLNAIKIASQVKAENATKAKVDVSFLDSAGKSLGHHWTIYIGAKGGGDPVTHDWKERSGVAAIPSDTAEIVIALQIYGPGKVWIDDLEATYVESNDTEEEKDEKEEGAKLDNLVEIDIDKDKGQYLHVPARNETAPEAGYGLLVVLPGGNGSADFHPFVSRIHANSLGDDFVLAQPIAKKWTDDQQIVWPTKKLKVKKMGYTTEKLIKAVVKDVGEKTTIDPKRVYLMGWSSGGPAVYASLMKTKSPAVGGIAAMSVYKPELLPKPKNARGRSIYILHSPDDRVCPYWMAKKGHDALTEAKVRTTLAEYEGGHGWQGDVFGNIKAGVDWLEEGAKSDADEE